MRSNRIHLPTPLASGAELALPDRAAGHVARVLRLRAGDAIVVFDGDGNEHDAHIEAVSSRAVRVTIGAVRVAMPEPALSVELVQGISRGERMDMVVQKSVELGVGAIRPLATTRSVVRLDARRAAARVEHWQAIAVAACEQCGRATVPQVYPIERFDRWLVGEHGASTALLLDPANGRPLGALAAPAGRATVLVGPEGGLEPAEAEAARQAGFAPVRLGPRVLRTETAALAALCSLQLLWGDLGSVG